MSLSKVNKQYLAYLSKYPLVTKSITAGVLAGLNETLASLVAGDIKKVQVGRFQIRHVLSPKIVTMVVYGSLILTPVSHKLYGILNRVFGGPNISKKMKIAQIASSLCFITPTLSAIFATWISLLNGYTPSFSSTTASAELAKIKSVVVRALKTTYPPILRSSLVTSLCCMVVAQNFIEPELWVVFFNFVYFVLGTVQNTRVKLASKKARDAKEAKETKETSGSDKQA
ncbi:Piso0_004490 [Millerozyma farinosa CBS 7064]|uniref:Piso0_004490 protein n=1 Tax=Pichia sorbitophila (strain ATCC MYA-4447 / BCRC 22081 / CBS 7064 / NBRC 10061 / NRRL Y-12695) TaxID=559304 RepID=G8Y8X9_PICSO|nr:Piso0_004490 [Millerozyma farinosa CBS 7064]CCE84924.1 Piso0_004490 [Millerozyma farinosa CBS 7064]